MLSVLQSWMTVGLFAWETVEVLLWSNISRPSYRWLLLVQGTGWAAKLMPLQQWIISTLVDNKQSLEAMLHARFQREAIKVICFNLSVG